MTAKKTILKIITKWQLLSVITFLLYWTLWYIIDYPVYKEGGYALNVILFDYFYCSAFTLCVMVVCQCIICAFSSWINKRWIFMLASISCLIVNILLAHLFEYVEDELFYAIDKNTNVFIEGMYIYSLVATILSILLLSNHHYKLYAIKLEEHKRNELALLKQQLDPHFMFNNLNTLDALIESDKETAHLYLNRLSQCYRFIVQKISVDTIEICEAVSFTRLYKDLLQISIPGHFIIEIDKGLEHSHSLIFPMSIQLLVENAVKHNRHSQKEPITISIKQEGDYILVSNTFQPIKQAITSTHIGLDNLRKHCLYNTGKDCVINQSNGFFEVRVPIIKTK